ncbi:MAG TPA: tetratricopeptide repeat protein [Bacteroidia bacterium]|jgi:tetratricopeptide (TPR) repeat protein|nr:tetratricopeptide repeat protein [Bacteroidia bacterium]
MKLRNSIILSFAFLFCLVASSTKLFAYTGDYLLLDSANTNYNKANYAKAVTFYQGFLKEGIESAQACYNLGNCYYKMNEFPKAILYYEKAEKLAPADADIQFNLQLANQKIVDKVPSDTPLFIFSGWKKFENSRTEKEWAIIFIFILCFSLLLFALYLTFSRILIKQICFWSGLVVFFLSLFTFYIAHQQYELLNSHDTAIVMTASVTVKGAPEEKSTQLFVLHEGTKVTIVKTDGDWTEIKLSNGSQGWLNSSDISAI